MRLHLILLAVVLSSPTAALAADFDGVWQVIQPIVQLKTTDGSEPPLKPEALRTYRARAGQLTANNRAFDSTLQCKPMGEPRTAYDPAGGPFEILVNKAVVAFAYTWNRMIRFAYISSAPPDPIGPTYYGTATAHWQGKSLIVDSQDFHDQTLLDAAGMPHSEQLKLTERYTLLKGGRELQEILRFDDPAVFTRPWQATVTYRRLPEARILEDVCIERLGITSY
ncbi:MAG: hypothetical protein ABSE43_06855 [Steroidobacteraceae bacterium]|jgi:hypothetical protein